LQRITNTVHRHDKSSEIVTMKIASLTPFQFRLATTILYHILSKEFSIDQSYSHFFNKVKVVNREQALITRVVGDIMRRLNYFYAVLGINNKNACKHVDRLVHLWHILNNMQQTHGARTEPLNEDEMRKKIRELKKNKPLVDGCPVWLEEHGLYELGDDWAAERHALAEAPKRFIRVNTLKISKEDLITRLKRSDVQTKEVDGVDTALEVISDASLFKLRAFEEGLFEQQDAGSQMIAPFLQTEPGMRVIDACAGSGGKTLHLAAISQGKGSIIALDTEEWKLKNLKQRARRDGVFNVETRVIDSTKVIKRLYNSADRVLLDVPCSGLGVLKRNPDTKWGDTPSTLSKLYELQANILENYSRMVKVGGKLVYSTCSIMPVENEIQIKVFLKKHKDEFELEDQHTVLPSKTGFDGFYMARLIRIK